MRPNPLFSAFVLKVSVSTGQEAALKSVSATTQDEKSNTYDKAVEISTFVISM